MILVADSGSSKTDWLLGVPKQQPKAFRTDGLNPYFLAEKDIIKAVKEQAEDLMKYAGKVTEVYFFGAGCSNPDRREIVSNALSILFKEAFISVDSDLLGSAYAMCGTEKGLCCVLGTGSNIAFFDGAEIHSGRFGLGYVLGDEGSGTWFGKKLVTDFLYGKMPGSVSVKFQEEYHLDKSTVIRKVYQESKANSYLASFSRFLYKIKDTSYGQSVVKAGLSEFIETNIKAYSQHHKYKCNFVGSIAYLFSTELTTLCEENGIKVGKILRQPINDLFTFILNREQVASL